MWLQLKKYFGAGGRPQHDTPAQMPTTNRSCRTVVHMNSCCHSPSGLHGRFVNIPNTQDEPMNATCFDSPDDSLETNTKTVMTSIMWEILVKYSWVYTSWHQAWMYEQEAEIQSLWRLITPHCRLSYQPCVTLREPIGPFSSYISYIDLLTLHSSIARLRQWFR